MAMLPENAYMAKENKIVGIVVPVFAFTGGEMLNVEIAGTDIARTDIENIDANNVKPKNYIKCLLAH